MTAPLIGITAGIQQDDEGKASRLVLGETYIQAVLRAGGIPVAISPSVPKTSFSDLLQRLDGFLFTGGPDIDPVLFEGVPHYRVYGIDANRDELEMDLVKGAVANKKPFLGICRGIQVINVALGGTLFTDIEDQVPGALKHDYYPGYERDYLAHPVSVDDGSLLSRIVNAGALQVNSLHHQAVKDVSPRLRPIAYSPDHLVEAVEVQDHFFGLGVQWHPECLPHDPEMQALFRALVEAAS
jgi:putative glutamine amidotransferase